MKAAAKTGRRGHLDSTLILVTYRHGFRVSELTALRWDQMELDSGSLHVSRIKKGTQSVHPIRGPEIRALRRLKRDYPATLYVFVTERKGPLTNSAVAKMIARAGQNAEFEFPGHDTRAIQQYLGHKNIQHTVRYTELASTRFKVAGSSVADVPSCSISSHTAWKSQANSAGRRKRIRQFLCRQSAAGTRRSYGRSAWHLTQESGLPSTSDGIAKRPRKRQEISKINDPVSVDISTRITNPFRAKVGGQQQIILEVHRSAAVQVPV